MLTNKEKYSELCKSEPSVPIFSRGYWLDAVCGENNWDVALFEKADRIVGALPYYIKKRFGISYISQPYFTPRLGPWIKYPINIKYCKKLSYEKEIIEGLISQLNKLKIVFSQHSLESVVTNWLPFYWNGFSQTTYYTYLIKDISNPQMVFENFHEDKKRAIRKSYKQDLFISFDLSVDELYQLHKETLSKKGKLISYSYNLISLIYKTIYDNNCGRVIYAHDSNNNIHCAQLFVYDAYNAFWLISIVNPEHRSSGGSDRLVFEAIKYLSDKTVSFDFDGSMIESCEESYRRFGTIQIPYSHIWKLYSKNVLVRFFIQNRIRYK